MAGWLQLCERELGVLVWEIPVSCVLPFTEWEETAIAVENREDVVSVDEKLGIESWPSSIYLYDHAPLKVDKAWHDSSN